MKQTQHLVTNINLHSSSSSYGGFYMEDFYQSWETGMGRNYTIV